VAQADPVLIRQMREQGTSWSEIARRTRLSRGTVQKVCGKAVT
jgi:DNA invertase Pin-like site-specific DNA recombinase